MREDNPPPYAARQWEVQWSPLGASTVTEVLSRLTALPCEMPETLKWEGQCDFFLFLVVPGEANLVSAVKGEGELHG